MNLLRKKDDTNKKLIQIQFEAIHEFDSRNNRTTRIANDHPEIFRSPFKPCN